MAIKARATNEIHRNAGMQENSPGEAPPIVTPRPGDERIETAKGESHPDCVDVASMDSFPCSDAPGYYPVNL